MSIDDVLNRVAEGAWSATKTSKPGPSTSSGTPMNAVTKPEGSDLVHSEAQEAKAPLANTAAPKDSVPRGAVHLPVGVRLLRQTSRHPSSDKPGCLKITDLEKFIGTQLADLDARLNSSVQIRGGGSVFEILRTLADVGLELAIERPAVESPDMSASIAPESSRDTSE